MADFLLTASPAAGDTLPAPAKSGVWVRSQISQGAQPRRTAVFLCASHGKRNGWLCGGAARLAGSLTRSSNPTQSVTLFRSGVAGFQISQGVLP